MTEAIDQQTVARDTRAMIHLRGIRAARVAREANVTPSALSQFLNGKYAGDADTIASKLAAWLENLRRREQLPASLIAATAFIPTSTAGEIVTALEYAQLAGDVALIAGMPGLGKTYALEHYAETRPSAWIATMSPDTGSPVPMLEEIGLSIGLRQLSGGAARMRRDVVRRVKATGGILLVDEAQHLHTAALETLRRIHDTGQVALALCGDLALPEKLDNFPQLYSRIGKRVVLLSPKPRDAGEIAAGFGLEGDEAADFLTKIAALGAGARTVVKTVRLAFLYAGGDGANGGGPSVDHLKAAWANIGDGGAS